MGPENPIPNYLRINKTSNQYGNEVLVDEEHPKRKQFES